MPRYFTLDEARRRCPQVGRMIRDSVQAKIALSGSRER